jgi:pimeloyl-ACP methyl ester carboxylesterase
MTTSDGYATTDDGVRLYFQSIGAAPRVLLVPNGPPLFDLLEPFAATHTVVMFDPVNRGRSDLLADSATRDDVLEREADDIEAVRRRIGAVEVDLLGHSYTGVVLVLYARRYPGRVRRVIQIGPAAPDGSVVHPRAAEDEALLQGIFVRMLELQRDTEPHSEERCRRFWDILRPLYVVDPADVSKLDAFARCHLETERRAADYVMTRIVPALSAARLRAEDVRAVTMPVLTIHGRRDRSAPYEGGRDWVRILPDARLVSVDEAGHMPWIEKAHEVRRAIETFLAGKWPAEATEVR